MLTVSVVIPRWFILDMKCLVFIRDSLLTNEVVAIASSVDSFLSSIK